MKREYPKTLVEVSNKCFNCGRSQDHDKLHPVLRFAMWVTDLLAAEEFIK